MSATIKTSAARVTASERKLATTRGNTIKKHNLKQYHILKTSDIETIFQLTWFLYCEIKFVEV